MGDGAIIKLLKVISVMIAMIHGGKILLAKPDVERLGNVKNMEIAGGFHQDSNHNLMKLIMRQNPHRPRFGGAGKEVMPMFPVYDPYLT
jgi:hypothetical protein